MKKLAILFTWVACLLTFWTAAFADQNKVYSQQDLLSEYTTLSPGPSLYKKLPIYGYLIKDTMWDNSPTFIQEKVAKDSWKPYGAVMIQLGSNNELEVYTISKDTLEKEYSLDDTQDVTTHYPRLMLALQSVAQEEGLDAFIRDNQIISLQLKEPVNMVKCSQMGIATNDEATIKSPSGRDQTKVADQDAYLRLLKTNETVTGFRLILEDQNADSNPVNYYPAPVSSQTVGETDSMVSFSPSATAENTTE